VYVSRALRLGPSRHLRAIGICAAIAVGASLGILAPPALAAPANDSFANRTDLGHALPIHVTDSNVGATSEAGEPRIGLLDSAGHSIWWAWEAPATEWVTVSTCGSPISSDVAVFEGTELTHLTRLGERNDEEGPACLYNGGKTWTFRAHGAHHYAIAADGNGFYVPVPPGDPEPPRPVVEGEIELTIEATPVPPNDNFDNATPIEAPVHEEPGGNRSLITQVEGYNWGATDQPGEPEHAGEPGGASVWFSWVAPETGEATIGIGLGGPGIVAVYTGGAVGELTPVGATVEPPLAGGVQISAIAGTKYLIAVDGKRSEATGEPEMGAFALNLWEKLKPGPGTSEPPLDCACVGEPEPIVQPEPITEPEPTAQPGPGPQLTIPPVTSGPTVRVAGHEVDSAAGTATFRFGSSTKGAKFSCSLDGKSYKACSPPFEAKGLKPGKHVFRVLAGAGGAAGARPAVVHFSVPRARRRQHAAG
jgi:hypothetical protein